MAERVTVVGNGAMATVCSILLDKGGHGVTMWGAFGESVARLARDRENRRLLPGVRLPDAVRLTPDDRDCFAGATLVLSAVPTQYMRGVWQRLAPHLPAGLPVVSVAKGIENGTLLRPTEILREVLAGQRATEPRSDGGGEQRHDDTEARKHGGSHPHSPSTQHSALSTSSPRPLAALSGPNIAGEIARYLPATAVAASDDAELARRAQAAFSTPWFRVYTNADVVGVELAGATKNVVAIAAGILDGMGAGDNAKAALVTRGLVEITRLGAAMGARPDTFAGLAGLGDLITTCVSPQGRNRSVGEKIGRGQKLADALGGMPSVAEGVPTTRSVRELARRHDVEMPITEAVHAILFEDKGVQAALAELMTREPKPEGRGV